jgi:predicted acylesterase/phospholipase RssA
LVVALIGPGVSVAGLSFARDADQFKELLRQGDLTLRFATVTLLRAHLAADMLFLVAYGLLLRASVRALTSAPLPRFAPHGPVLLMIADAAENVLALQVLRTIGEGTIAWPASFAVLNAAAAAKWLLAGAVFLCLAVGWRREAVHPDRCHRLRSWLIAGAFAVGGAASIAVTGGLAFSLPSWLVLTALLAPAAGLLLQFSLLHTGTLTLRFLYLSRAPLIILLILAAFGPIALGPAVDLLGGILVAGNFIGVAVTTAAAIAVVFACGTQINIVRAHAWERVQDRSLRILRGRALASYVFWTGVVAAASLLFSVALVSLSLTVWRIAAGVVVGAGTVLVLLFIIELAAAYLSFKPSGRPLPQLAVPFRRVGWLAALLNQATNAAPPAFKSLVSGGFASRLFGNGSGYVETLPNGQRRILPGHTFATIQFVLTFALFWLVLYRKSLPGDSFFYGLSPQQTDAAFLVPTVTSIVLLLLLNGWVLAALAFFLDRYRIPLFTIVLAAALITGGWSRTDYRVPTNRESTDYQLATPGQVLKAFGDRPLVVAAAGGGIQAGAWTMRVLRGLDESLNGTLRQRVAMISSVSGGSMGALYYGAFEDKLDDAEQQALKPSLDEVATAFVRRDIFGVIGLRLGPDRGAALEETWERRLPEAPEGSRTLRGWSDAARDFAVGTNGTRPFPAFLFNSTVVETGRPIAFATTQFPTRQYRTRIGEGTQEYPTVESANFILRLADGDDAARDIGLKVVTAARLSAAFPYVSPAATLDMKTDAVEPYHLVDGGYYDMYGLVALSQWVDDALEEMSRNNEVLPSTIGVVIARGLAASDSALPREGAPAQPFDKAIANQGWRWQLTAPPAAGLHAHLFAQWAGGMQTLRLLIGKWKGRGVKIIPRLFDYPGEGETTPVCQASPLSWKLTTPQQQCLESAWNRFKHAPLPASLR